MKATISWWNLEQSGQSIESLRTYLKAEGVAPWEAVQGMRSKIWISDPVSKLWGAVVVWDAPDAMRQPLPPNRALELIGYAPATRITFDVEASIEQNQIRHWLAETDEQETR
jgi:hypothetical protein